MELNEVVQTVSSDEAYVSILTDGPAAEQAITTSAEADDAGDWLKRISAKRKEVKDLFAPAIRAAHEAHKAAIATHKNFDAPMAEAEGFLRTAIAAFAERQAAAARAAEAEQKKAEAEARAALEEGEAPKPETLAKAAAPKATAQTKGEGWTTRDVWKAELDDLAALVKAVAEGKAPITLLALDEKEANALARKLKAKLDVPGLRAVNSKTTVAR